MQPFRQSSLVQQPDGEIIRAIVDQGSLSDADSGIQFNLGALSLKVGQEEAFIQEPAHFEASGQHQARSPLLAALLAQCCAALTSMLNMQRSSQVRIHPAKGAA